MEDLGEATATFVETFSCTEEPSSRLPKKAIPTTHGNLLASSSLYGHLFAAVGSSIVTYNHASIRGGDADPVALVDLSEENVTNIHALALGSNDTVVALVTRCSKRSVVILNILALANGKIHALPGPSGLVSAFAVSDLLSKGTTQVLATLEEVCVQLHVFTADGTTPTKNISVSNARCIALTPEGDLLAVGTERGSVVIHNVKTGEPCTTIVEVESGWVPFSTHFADNRSLLVAYNCDTEVSHVVWHLSSDGTSVTGHSPLGELCLSLFPFDNEDSTQVPTHPMITNISLHDWDMCVIGSSMSTDVEIIRKSESEWEVWKFDEGKSPTLPTDDNDDDTYCVGLAFDLNNTAVIPGSDAASPKINPMPRVIVYTSDSLLLPFALIDSNPGVKCDAVRSAVKFPPIPINLRSIESASVPDTDVPSPSGTKPNADGVTYSEGPVSLGQREVRPVFPKQGDSMRLARDTARVGSYREEALHTDAKDSIQRDLSSTRFGLMNTGESMFGSSTSKSESRSTFGQQPTFAGMNSFLDNFSFQGAPEEHVKPTTGVSPFGILTKKPDQGRLEIREKKALQEKPKVSLAPSLDVAEAEANGGDLFGLLKSIMTEMSEELKISAEAEKMVSQETSAERAAIVSSINETRKELTKLLEVTRTLFRNEATLRNTVSSTLSRVLSLSREFERMSLEFRVKKADGVSRSLRTEDKEIDDKIASKERDVLRSISSIEDRLNSEAEIKTRRSSPAELVQQVYSSLSLQGIRIKRVRSLLAALSERMDNQDKGGRLSHLGLSLARLEKLNINEEEARETPDRNKRRESVRKEAVRTPNGINNTSPSHATNSQGDDIQLLPSDVRTVMRRLAMSGGRASISITVPQSRSKRGRIVSMGDASTSDIFNDQRTSLNKGNGAKFAGQESSISASTNLGGPRVKGFGTMKGHGVIKAESAYAPENLPSSTENRLIRIGKGNQVKNSRLPHTAKHVTHVDSGIPSSDIPEVREGNAPFRTSAVPSEPQAFRSRSTSITGGIPSASLPPKKPLGQSLFPASVQRSTAMTSLLGSTTFGDEKPKQPSQLSPDTSGFESEKWQRGGFGNIAGANAAKELKSDDSLSLGALTASTATGVGGLFSQDIGIQPASNDQQRSSSTANTLSSTAVVEVGKSMKSAPFASIPSDDDEVVPKSSSAAPTLQFPKLSSSGDQAGWRSSITASGPVPVGQVEASKKASMSGFFAALPPDSDAGPILRSKGDRLKRPLASKTQESERAASASELFAALPPDLDADDAGKQTTSDSGGHGKTFPLVASSSLRSTGRPSSLSTKKESLATSDLFAALPPDDNGNVQVQPTGINAGTLIRNEANKGLKETEDNSAIAAGGNDAKRSNEPPPTSLFPGGVSSANTGSPQISQLASPFGALEGSSAAFGNASLFGATPTASQSATSVSAPERRSSRDGTSSDESEEESTRLGGMDTSSGGGGVFGASSSGQVDRGFGFGSKPENVSAGTSFGQSSASPFGSRGRSQPFGQSTSSQASPQTGFGSLAGMQGSVPSAFQTAQPTFEATSAFGTGNATPAFGMGSTFGAQSQLGATSSFGLPSQLGMGSSSFPDSTQNFGSGMPAPKFGESSFGMAPSFGNLGQSSTSSGFGSSSSSSTSPFGNVAGGGFGGATGGGSGFAALAGGQSGSLVFGNGGGPPAFTSAAFSQRRA